MRRPPLPAALLALALVLPGTALGATAAPRDAAPPTQTTPVDGPPQGPAKPLAGADPVTVPNGKPLFLEGQDGRVVVNGPWLLRLDREDAGLGQRWYSGSSVAGWSRTTVPNAWNAGDDSVAGFTGAVAWYRKDFRLPSKVRPLSWVVRFESVNFDATVWLNGRRIATHSGGYVPFEVPLANVNRSGVNRLVIRVDNRRKLSEQTGDRTDHPVSPGGWWNYGGLLREVYLRPVNRVDLANVAVTPNLRCPRCAATVAASADVRNATGQAQQVHLTGRFGAQTFELGTRTVPAGQTVTFSGALTIRRPKLWSPAHPRLYRVRLSATARQQGDAKPVQVAGYTLETGIRSIKVSNGQLLLNGEAVHFRGVAIHEDTLRQGAAMDNATRGKLVALVKQLGATVVRSHYPLHPEFQQLADRNGILLWSEVPAMYQLPDVDLAKAMYRNQAFQELRENIAENRNHPSVAIWSVGNEMPSQVGSGQAAYLRDAAALVRQLDPTRPVGLAFAGHPETDCQAAYAPIDVLGMNDYFGWYTGADGNIADRDNLSAYLDALRACYPKQAIAVTEYGAEANRDGPPEEKGTYAFQNEFIQYHLDVFASKPWLAGSVYWALQEFRVKPYWGGGNPWPTAPVHTKGLVRLDWTKKQGFSVLRNGIRKLRQFVPESAAR